MSVNSRTGDAITLTSDRLVINQLEITDPAVISAVHAWGRTHPDGPDVALAQLPAHIEALLVLGARVNDMAHGSISAELISSAARSATESAALSVDRIRSELSVATEVFTESVTHHLDQLLCGDTSAVADALRETLASETRAMTESMTSRIDAAVTASVSTGLTGAMDRLHDGITAVGTAVGEVRDQVVSDAATAAVVDKSAVLKGANFEEGICAVLDELALAASAEFEHTGRTPGVSGHGSGDSLKGDGVWHTGEHTLVIETHDSQARSGHANGHRDGWSRYLAAAMRNRGAGAALGIVRTPEQNKGQLLRDFGSTMAVVACDPTKPEDIMRLKFVVQVMSLAARYHGSVRDTPSVYGPDLGIARRAVLDLAERAAVLADIEKLALKTSKAATELHDRVAGLKVGMAAPLDRAREVLEAAVVGDGKSVG